MQGSQLSLGVWFTAVQAFRAVADCVHAHVKVQSSFPMLVFADYPHFLSLALCLLVLRTILLCCALSLSVLQQAKQQEQQRQHAWPNHHGGSRHISRRHMGG